MEDNSQARMRIRSTRYAKYWCTYHLVWIPKYKDILIGEVAEYTKGIINKIIAELGCKNLALNVMPDHIHVFVLCPPRLAPAYVVKYLKGKSARKILQKFPQLKDRAKHGRLWTRDYFVATEGNVTADIIKNMLRSSGRGMKRTSVVKLIPDRDTEAKLKALCSLSSKLWNEVTHARRMQFFGKQKVNLKTTYKEFQEKYKKLIGIVTAQQILNKNNQAWSSFFRELKEKKEGGLPGFIKKVNPPGYKKKGKTRQLWVVIRNDQYKIMKNKIIIKWLGAIGRIEVEYSGLVHLKEKQGSLEIHYDSDTKTWYAHINFEVEEKAVRGVWREVPLTPKGNLKAGIDLGVNNLMAIYVENGTSTLINGRPLKSIVHYVREKVSEYQSKINKQGVKTTHKLRLLYERGRRQAKSYIDTQVRRVVEWLYSIGVSTVYVGHPKYIAQQKGNFNVSNVWSYGYVIERLTEVAEEYGIKVEGVDEAYTSSTCPIHGDSCGKRIVRGLFKCFKLNKVFNADIVGAFNILRKSISPSPRKGIGVIGWKPSLVVNGKRCTTKPMKRTKGMPGL